MAQDSFLEETSNVFVFGTNLVCKIDGIYYWVRKICLPHF